MVSSITTHITLCPGKGHLAKRNLHQVKLLLIPQKHPCSFIVNRKYTYHLRAPHERCHLDSSYYANQEYKPENLSVDVKSYERTHFWDHFWSVSSCFAIPPLSMPKFDGEPRKYVSFIRKFHAIISSKIGPQLRIHYLIAACEGEAAESIGHCVSFKPLEGYAEAPRTLETLFGNPRVTSNISISRLTKRKSIQFLDSMEKGRKSTFSELTEFIAMKGQATTFGLDCLPNIKKEERVATERSLRHTNLPISHPNSTLMLTSSSTKPMQPRPTRKLVSVVEVSIF